MPRIHPVYFNCVFYLYPSIQAAKTNQKAGGSGFVVSIPAKTVKGARHLYVVTNTHVIDGYPEYGISPSRVARMNTKIGTVEFSESSAEHWERHSVDDIAVAYLSVHSDSLKYSHVPINQFVTEHMIDKYGIGQGDNIFMVGRFAHHDGKKLNVPSVRFGNISMMHNVPMEHPSGRQVESFAVEMRSIGGYSGSPVFVYFNAAEPRPFIEGVEPPVTSTISVNGYQEDNIGPLLLGVDWGHIPRKDYLYDPDTGRRLPNQYYIKSNSNMAGVVPAWKLYELLNIPKLVKEREINEQEAIKQQKGSPNIALDFIESEPNIGSKET